MTADELNAALGQLFGDHKGALTDAGRALGVSPDALRHMVNGRRPVPAGVVAALRERLALRHVAPPVTALRQEHERDEQCAHALRPHLDALLARATDAKWYPGEVCAAILGWVAHTVAKGAGAAAQRNTVGADDEMRALLDLRRTVELPARRFPAPWAVARTPDGWRIDDAAGRAVASVYGRDGGAGASDADMTVDEARRVAIGITLLPQLLSVGAAETAEANSAPPPAG